MSLTLKTDSEGKLYWANCFGLMASPYFNTKQDADIWRKKFYGTN